VKEDLMLKKLLTLSLILALGMVCFLVSCKDSNDSESPVNYIVSFQSGDGTAIADKKVRKDATLNLELSEFQPELTGYFFDGWYLQGDTEQELLASIKVTKNITLVAKWQKAVIVTLDLQGGTWEGAVLLPDTYHRRGSTFHAVWYEPAKRGFIFKYWFLQGDPNKEEKESIQVDNDITLVALWEEGWVVEFELNGGVYQPNYLTVANNAIIQLASIKPVKDGYALEGWYYDASFASRAPDLITVTGNIKLYAKWISLEAFDSLLGVWMGDEGTYLLYFEESHLLGFYFSINETREVQIRSFEWTDSILDGKTYAFVPGTLSLGEGEGAKNFTPETRTMSPAGKASLSKTWIMSADNVADLLSLYLNEDGSGYLHANGRIIGVSYNASGTSSLTLLNGAPIGGGAGEVLLTIPVVDDKPFGFEVMGDGGGDGEGGIVPIREVF
jgi:uncharacterized repeat protein (TIGR02543 family)